MHSIIGHISINNTSTVLTYCLMIKRIIPLEILGILHQDITYECICAFYGTVDADEKDVILHEKKTVQSEYDNELDDGED